MSFFEYDVIPRYAEYNKSHATISHRITFDYQLSSPALMEEGKSSGYFDDSAMHALLALDEDDLLMHSGTYGPKEPGAEPVVLAFLREGNLDQHFIPFAPIHLSSFHHLILHDINGQPYPKKALWKSLKEDVEESLEEAMKLSKLVGLSLPSYIQEILPRLLYVDPETPEIFVFQLRPYFTPSALCARWTRINRVKILLHMYINLCYHILHPNEEWRIKQPVGIHAEPVITGGPALNLLHAYLFFGVPIAGPPLDLPENYSLELARDALLDPISCKAPLVLELEGIIQLPEGSNDVSTFKESVPHYDMLIFGEDGVKLMSREKKLLMYEDDRDVTLIQEPGPLKTLAPFFPPLDNLIGNSPTPTSSMSTSATPSIFSSTSTSSGNPRPSEWESNAVAPGTQTRQWPKTPQGDQPPIMDSHASDSFRPECQARSNARSRKYRGPFRQPRARNKGHAIYECPIDSSQFPPSQIEARDYYPSEKPRDSFVSRHDSNYLPVTPTFPSCSREAACPIET